MSDESMTPAEMKAVRDSLMLCIQALAGNPMLTDEQLERFVRACEHADAIGPFIDPTSWMQAHGRLDAMTEDARDLARFLRRVRERHPEMVLR